MNLPTELEPLLVSAVKYWLQDYTTLFTGKKDAQGNKLEGPITVYRGFLPILMSGEINPNVPTIFPHVICQFSDLDLGFEESNLGAKLCIGVWDDNEDYSGYQGVIRIMQTISAKLYWERILGNQYPLKGRVKGKILQGSELWPAFYGLMEIEFEGPIFVSRMEGIQEPDVGHVWPDYVCNPGVPEVKDPYQIGS